MPKHLAYMWQASEYRPKNFMGWVRRTRDFRRVSRRGNLVTTKAGLALRVILAMLSIVYWVLAVVGAIILPASLLVVYIPFAIIAYAPVLIYAPTIPLSIAHMVYVRPRLNMLERRARSIFGEHPGTVIAVAGSYGKTSLKELLGQLLGAHMTVAYTEGNRNVLSSQAYFATKLIGKEDVVIVEFGEGKPGDVARMTKMVQPDYAFLTGLAPNHLDEYQSIEDIARDFRSLLEYVGPDHAFIAGQTALIERFGKDGMFYGESGVSDLSISDIAVSVEGTDFDITHNHKTGHLKTLLLGRHNVPMVGAAVYLALTLGVKRTDIRKTLATIQPYEHRFKPRAFNGGWLIDDTYNGSIEGMRAGLAFLSEVECSGKKRYATPGLVDQGEETQRVHEELARAITACSPDVVYLMNNSATAIVREKLGIDFKGVVKIIDDPLEFYLSIGDHVAQGDILLCQNDLPDFYTS